MKDTKKSDSNISMITSREALRGQFSNAVKVQVNKDIKGGIPVVSGTRIPVAKIVYLYKERKIPPSLIALQYYTQLSVDHIKKVIEWCKKHKKEYGLAI